MAIYSQTQTLFRDIDTHFSNGHPARLRGVVAVIPAYNEARFIGSMVLATLPYVDQVLVVDDGSSDETAAVAAAAGATVIAMETNSGKGAALKRGLETACQTQGVRAIVLMDGDGQHLPRELPQVVQPVLDGAADMVVGSRFLEVRSEIPWWRQIGQHGLTWVTNTTSGVPLTDSQSGYRAISPQTASLFRFSGEGFSIESEMQFVAKEHKLRVVEVPITCIYAEPPKRNPVTHGLQVLDGILRLIGQTRPMWFFGLPSVLLLLGGLLMGNTVIQTYQANDQLAIGYALITVLLLILGAVGLSTGIMLHSILSLLRKHVRTAQQPAPLGLSDR